MLKNNELKQLILCI